jgi:hypothetical protein
MARHRKQIGFSLLALPAYAALGASLRLVELAGGVAASLTRQPSSPGGVSSGLAGKSS